MINGCVGSVYASLRNGLAYPRGQGRLLTEYKLHTANALFSYISQSDQATMCVRERLAGHSVRLRNPAALDDQRHLAAGSLTAAPGPWVGVLGFAIAAYNDCI